MPVCANKGWIEHMMLWPEELLVYPFILKDGQYSSEGLKQPGTGVWFKPEVLQHYKVAVS